MGSKPNVSLKLSPAELAWIGRHYGNRKTQAIRDGLAALMRERAGEPRITVQDVATWLAQSREQEAQLLRLIISGEVVDLGELISQLHSVIDVWGQAHAQISRTHWQQVNWSGVDPEQDGPDAGDAWAEESEGEPAWAEEADEPAP